MRKCNVCEEWFKSLDKHHIQSRSKGGSNKKENITYLCCNCHRKVHTGDIILEGNFYSTDGVLLIHREKGTPSIMGFPDPEVYIIPNN